MLLFLLLLLQADADYRQGVALIEKGQAEAAIAPLSRAAERSPDNAQVWKALGVAYAAGSDYASAAPAFANACRLDPKLPDACYYSGRAEYASNRFEASLDALAKALPLEKQPWRVQLAIAQSLEALGRAAEAERNFQASIAGGGARSPEPGVAYSVFLIRQGRGGEATAPLEAVLKDFPNSAAAHLELGRVLFQANRLPEAIARLERAVQLDPKSTQAHVLLGKAYTRAGRDTEAQREADAASQGSRTVR